MSVAGRPPRAGVPAMKAFRVEARQFDPIIVQTIYARTRAGARMEVARQIQDAGWEDNIGRIFPSLRVTRSPELDEPARVLDPTMTGAERELLEHALGGWTGRPGTQPDRNYFCDDEAGTRVSILVGRGWMTPGRTINEGRDRYFHVTPAGFRALGLPAPVTTS